MVEATEKIKFFDPHFHILDREDGPLVGECADMWKSLYPHGPKFLLKDYEKMIMDGNEDKLELLGGMFVEVVATYEKRVEEA